MFLKREFFIDNLLVRIHFIIMMIRWTGLAPWEFEFPFPGSLTSTFLGQCPHVNPCVQCADSVSSWVPKCLQGYLAYKKTRPHRTLQ
jgi:hypothetical protein